MAKFYREKPRDARGAEHVDHIISQEFRPQYVVPEERCLLGTSMEWRSAAHSKPGYVEDVSSSGLKQ